MNAQPTSPPISGTATSAGVIAGAVVPLGPSRRWRPWDMTAREDHHHAHQGDRRRPAEANLELGAQHVELAHEQAEGREAEEGDQPETEDATEHGATAQQGRDAFDLARAFGQEDLTRSQEQHPLGQAVAQNVEKHRGDGQGRACRRPQGDETHVLDAVVGEHPLVVPLGEQQRRCHQKR